MEFIMTSPEPPIISIENSHPIYKEVLTIEEQNRIKIFQDIENGAMDFVNLIKKVFGNTQLYIDNESMSNWINLFCDIPTTFEKEKFEKLGMAFDASHEDYKKFPNKWFSEEQ